MSLAFKLGSQFERRLQDRGRYLSDTGAVSVTDQGPDHIYATVRGSQEYEVRVTYTRDARNRDNLLVFCTCPYFDDYARCKHVWAVIVEASRARSLPNAEYARFLRIDREPAAQQGGLIEPVAPHYPIPQRTRTPPWKEYLGQIQATAELRKSDPEWPDGFELLYVVDPPSSRATGAVVLDLFSRSRKKNGEPTVWKDFRISHTRAGQLPDPVDTDIVPMLLGGTDTFSFNYSSTYGTSTRKALPHALALKVIPRAAAAGRLALRADHLHQFAPLEWDQGEAWRLLLEVRQDDRDQWTIVGALVRGEERMPLAEPVLILRGGFVVARGRVALLEDEGAYAWIEQLLAIRSIPFPDRERDEVLASLLNTAHLPRLDLDEPLRFEERHGVPRAALRISQARSAWGEEQFIGKTLFDYGSGWSADPISGRGVWMPGERVFWSATPRPRPPRTNNCARPTPPWKRGLDPESQNHAGPDRAPVLRAGWQVEADGKAFRAASGHASGCQLRHRLVRAARRGGLRRGARGAARTADGAAPRRNDGAAGRWQLRAAAGGMAGKACNCSPAWASREGDHYALPAESGGAARRAAGRAAGGQRRRGLRARPASNCASSTALRAAEQPAGFAGQLRDYQREGLGWLQFLRRFGFGGCLADDMGLGKTVQVLALLEARRAASMATRRRRPAAVAGRRAAVADLQLAAGGGALHAAAAGARSHRRGRATTSDFERLRPDPDHLRHAAARHRCTLKEIEFDYVILDEAQAIKNAQTKSAKAARLLHGRAPPGAERHAGRKPPRRTVEPVRVPQSRACWAQPSVCKGRWRCRAIPSEETRQLLAQALRPFILRRTKEQVAQELPPKTRADALLRTGGARSAALRRAARPLPRFAAGARSTSRGWRVEDPRARSAAAAAPGGLPSGLDRRQTRSTSPAPSSRC